MEQQKKSVNFGELVDKVYENDSHYSYFIAMVYAGAKKYEEAEMISAHIGLFDGILRWFHSKEPMTVKYRSKDVKVMNVGSGIDEASTVVKMFGSIPIKGDDEDACTKWIGSNKSDGVRITEILGPIIKMEKAFGSGVF